MVNKKQILKIAQSDYDANVLLTAFNYVSSKILATAKEEYQNNKFMMRVMAATTQEAQQTLWRAISMNDFWPRDLHLLEMALSDDFDDIAGEFSTFDFELHKMVRRGDPWDKIASYISATSTQAESVAALPYATDIVKIIDSPDSKQFASLSTAGQTATTAQWRNLLQHIADKLRRMQHITVPLRVVVTDSWDDASGRISYHTTSSFIPARYATIAGTARDGTQTRTPAIVINRAQVAMYSPCNFFDGVITAFAWAFGWFINDAAPNKGGLGEQKAHICKQLGNNPESDWINPLNINSEHFRIETLKRLNPHYTR